MSTAVPLSTAIARRVRSLLRLRGWTQRDLAAALNKRPSEITKWLSPGHNLTLRSLEKLEDALGAPVVKVCAPVSGSTPAERREEREEIVEKIARYLQGKEVKTVHLFGSVARAEQGEDSDIDLYVDFKEDARITLFSLARMHTELSELTGRPVDIVVAGSEYDFVKTALEVDQMLVYGQA